MVQEAPFSAPPRRSAGEGLPSDVAGCLVGSLLRLGIRPVLSHGPCGYTVQGTGISQSLRRLDACVVTRQREFARIRALLFERCAVTISLVEADGYAPRTLERVLRQLRRACSAPCIDRRLLGLALCGEHLPLPAYLLMSRVLLGDGPRYVMLDNDKAQCSSAATSHCFKPVYSTLYQQRTRRRVLTPVFGASLRSRCALLPDECGNAISAPLALLAPSGSAWLPLTINLCRYSDSRGKLSMPALLGALRQGLRVADSLFDQLYWADAQQRDDARENRRIAVLIQGVGDLVTLQRANPSSIGCLRSLNRVFAAIHDCLWTESRTLAMERGLLPALAARDPSKQIDDLHSRSDWQKRWQAALTRAAVRHRNLLVMSPYELLPQSGASGVAYTDLLPLLGYADALSFAGKPAFMDWRFEDYRAFHQRVGAVMQRRNAASFIATGV